MMSLHKTLVINHKIDGVKQHCSVKLLISVLQLVDFYVCLLAKNVCSVSFVSQYTFHLFVLAEIEDIITSPSQASIRRKHKLWYDSLKSIYLTNS